MEKNKESPRAITTSYRPLVYLITLLIANTTHPKFARVNHPVLCKSQRQKSSSSKKNSQAMCAHYYLQEAANTEREIDVAPIATIKRADDATLGRGFATSGAMLSRYSEKRNDTAGLLCVCPGDEIIWISVCACRQAGRVGTSE